MNDSVLFKAIVRYFDETKVFLDQLTDKIVFSEPVASGRPLGELVLHILRSIEYYLTGLAKNHWEILTYNLDSYKTAEAIKQLYTDIVRRCIPYLKQIQKMNLKETIQPQLASRPATKAEILLEMLEHNIQHRGQLLTYYRLLGITPAKQNFII